MGAEVTQRSGELPRPEGFRKGRIRVMPARRWTGRRTIIPKIAGVKKTSNRDRSFFYNDDVTPSVRVVGLSERYRIAGQEPVWGRRNRLGMPLWDRVHTASPVPRRTAAGPPDGRHPQAEPPAPD
ncbi:hypothetical protein GCM10017562_09500 [Streptomyces roseofulvus]